MITLPSSTTIKNKIKSHKHDILVGSIAASIMIGIIVIVSVGKML